MIRHRQIHTVSRILYLIILMAMLSPDTHTQQRSFPLADPGPRMIYVNLGADLVSSERPRNNAAAVTVERRDSQHPWQVIATVKAPSALEEFQARLASANALMSGPINLLRIPARALWEKIQRYGRLDSLGFWSGVLPVRVASGSVFADTTVSPGAVYEYAISPTDASGKKLRTIFSTSVSSPGSPHFGPLHLVESRGSAAQNSIQWVLNTGTRPAAYLVFRQNGVAGEFQAFATSRVITGDKSSTFITVQDTLIRANSIYRYYLVPLDYYGNSGQPSDTAMVASYTMRSVPLPEFLSAVSNDSLGGIELSWHLRKTELVRSIRIERSRKFDSGFDPVAEVPREDSTWVDLQVLPMQQYVYRLVLLGPLGEQSPASARVFGIFETHEAPLPVAGLRADRTRSGVRLRWIRTDQFLSGYYVFRNEGISDSLVQISPLIPARDSIVTYTDTTIADNRGQYLYSVRAENTSHILGPFSDTAAVSVPAGPAPAPSHLMGYAEGTAAVLTWDDLYENNAMVAGYVVHRRELGKNGKTWSSFHAQSDTIPPEQNNFVDTSLVLGVVYEYAVQTISFTGKESNRSEPLRLQAAFSPVPAPAGLTAVSSRGSVVLRWNPLESTDIVRYNIYRYQRGQKPGRLAGVKASDDPGFTDKTVRRGQLYFYYVTSVSTSSIESTPAMEVSIRP